MGGVDERWQWGPAIGQRNIPEPARIAQMKDEVLREVEQFLYREARMLDNRQFREWLELLTDDVR